MIRIGSRGSQLARWQSDHIARLLRTEGHEVSIEIIRTTGDRMQDVTFAQVGTKGMFTREIEEALAEGRVDLAVHSLKDLPTELPGAFTISAIPQREDPRDVFVSVDFASFSELPSGATVGTSSLRRQSQLRAVRPDIDFVEFRGNVDTRLRKLAEGQAHGIVLAAAGLARLGRTEWVREYFAADVVCPAAGQGALAVECRAGDTATSAAVAFLDDADTRFAVTAERAALSRLGGGCQVPIGIHCVRSGAGFEIAGAVATSDGSRVVRAAIEGPASAPEELGSSLAVKLLHAGAREILFVATEFRDPLDEPVPGAS
ncbi:MAG TPA: hydroxymethylbilane synthase [Acidisarcina sp.]